MWYRGENRAPGREGGNDTGNKGGDVNEYGDGGGNGVENREEGGGRETPGIEEEGSRNM